MSKADATDYPQGLTEFDVQVLRLMNGEDVEGMVGGAGMNVSAAFLKGRGLVSGYYDINDTGRAYLAGLDDKE